MSSQGMQKSEAWICHVLEELTPVPEEVVLKMDVLDTQTSVVNTSSTTLW